jgi:hypothetical protein
MGSVSVTINGILWDHASKSGRPVTLVGEAYLTGLGVGGGPIMPEPPPGYPANPIYTPPGTPEHPITMPPPGIWPTPPVGIWPTPPGPPGYPANPIYPPPGIWPSPPGAPGYPSHPIYTPPGAPSHPIAPPPTEPPTSPSDPKPPPEDGGWGWWPPYGWVYYPGPSEPGPK